MTLPQAPYLRYCQRGREAVPCLSSFSYSTNSGRLLDLDGVLRSDPVYSTVLGGGVGEKGVRHRLDTVE
jgi:hypothetical protein